MDDLLTISEAATFLGKAPRTVRGYVDRGLLPLARRVNARLLLVHRADVEYLRLAPPRSGVRRLPRRPEDPIPHHAGGAPRATPA